MSRNFQQIYRISVYLLIFFSPLSVYWPIAPSFSPKIFEMYATPVIYLTDFFVAFVILWGCIGILKNKSLKAILKTTHPLILLFTGIIFLILLSTPGAFSRPLAGYYAIRWVVLYILFWCLIANPIDLAQTARVFFASAVFQGLIGLAQFVLRSPLGIPGEMALDVNQAGSAKISVAGIRWLRAYGLTFHPNVLGGFLLVGLILSLPFLKKSWAKLCWWLICGAWITSFSRSAWLAGAIIVPITLAWIFWKYVNFRKSILVTAGGLLVVGSIAFVLLFDQISARFQPFQTRAEFASLFERGQLIEIAFSTVKSAPFFGIGIGNFPIIVLKSGSSAVPHFVHNVPLLLVAECGLFASFLWYGLWLWPASRLKRYWNKNLVWPLIFMAAWFAVGIVSLWDSYPWTVESGRILSIILLAFVYRSSWVENEQAN